MASTFGERDERVMPATYYHARRQREVGHQVFSGGARTTVVIVRVDILSKEYPPNVYGGAGVHVVELVKALRARGDIDAQVRAFGQVVAEAGTTGYPDLPQLAAANATMQTLGVDVAIAADCGGADLVHSHTWYANMAGHLASLLHGVPHVISAHSLEPLRPWKAEQLGGGYRVSSWVERTAYEAAAAVIAVSHGMRADILRCYPAIDPETVRVVHNGIDADLWSPDRSDAAKDVCRSHGVDPDGRSIIFVGRQTRQKGLPCMLRAAAELPDDVQLILCAGAPDTKEIGAEIQGLITELQQTLPRRRCTRVRDARRTEARRATAAGIAWMHRWCRLPHMTTAGGIA
mgnify:CR=1 FL=1